MSTVSEGQQTTGPMAKSGPLPGFMDTVLQEPSCAHSSEYLLWQLLHRVEKLHHRLCGPCPLGKNVQKLGELCFVWQTY